MSIFQKSKQVLMRILLLILFVIVCYNCSECQRIKLAGSVEKYEDPFDPGYYPIWSGSISYSLSKDTTVSKYVEVSGWGNADERSFIYVNITINLNAFWISINPLYSDIYNPTIQIGYSRSIFHPPR